MNCDEVTRILNDQDVGTLETAKSREIEAHLAVCESCETAWRIHVRVDRFRNDVPELPATLRSRIGSSRDAASSALAGRRPLGRLIGIGGLLVIGAAAAAVMTAGYVGTDKDAPDAEATAFQRAEPAQSTAAVGQPSDAVADSNADSANVAPAERRPAPQVVGVSRERAEDGAEFELPLPFRSTNDIPLKTSDFTFVRIRYSEYPEPRGRRASPWRVDYPDAEVNFSRYVAELTGLNVDPDGLILDLTSPTLDQYPFVYMVEGGHLTLSDAEAAALRDYLLGGGFLMVDDFWGETEWASLAAEMARAFPDREPVELWAEHEVFWSYYAIGERPGVPGISSLMLGGDGRESGEDARFRGLFDDDGRLMAIFLHNMDLGDGWEHVDDPVYPKRASLGSAIPFGINVVIYALSH